MFSAFLEECFLSTPCSVKFVIMKKTPFAESNCATHIVLIATKVVYWLATCNLLVIDELVLWIGIGNTEEITMLEAYKLLVSTYQFLTLTYSQISVCTSTLSQEIPSPPFGILCSQSTCQEKYTLNSRMHSWEVDPYWSASSCQSPPVCTSSGVAATHHVWWGGP